MYLIKFRQANKGYVIECLKKGATVALVSGKNRKEIINKVENELTQRKNRLNTIPYSYRDTYLEGIEVYKQILNKLY